VDTLIRSLGLSDEAAIEADEDFDADLETGFGVEATSAADLADERRAILERLARREMSAEDAAAALRELGAGS
jgi:DNA-binding transcriptional ArsR family regulator